MKSIYRKFFIPAVLCSTVLSFANADDSLMLSGDWLPDDPHQIDYSKLPRVPSKHIVISDVRAEKGVNQHNYLAFYDDRYFAMWSDGPGVEDRVGQRVKFATSKDGENWSEPSYLTPEPPNSGPDSPLYNTRSPKGMRWIARGFWQREGELLALCSLDEAAGFFGPSLDLRAFRWHDSNWTDAGLVADNAINNFPPQKIATGDWMMSRRTYDYKTTGVHFLVGGTKSINDWESFPVLGTSSELSAEEPLWWPLPDKCLSAMFRDNRQSKYLYRSVSTDQGRTWTTPKKTNFPDATSKIYGFQLSNGKYILVSNSNPRARDPLTIAISDDGLVFNKLAWLVGGRHVDYPHAIEHDGHLLVAFAGKKQSVEVLKIELSALDEIVMPDSVELEKPLPPIRIARSKSNYWIDLGDEGKTLFVKCDLIVPDSGKKTRLSLATSTGLERVTIAIDDKSRLSARLFKNSTTGPELIPGSKHTLTLQIKTHREKPDQLIVEMDSSDKPIMVEGSSDANLSRAIVSGNADGFKKIRVASNRKALADAKPVKTE